MDPTLAPFTLDDAEFGRYAAICENVADRHLDGTCTVCPPQVFIVERDHATLRIQTVVEILDVPFNAPVEKSAAMQAVGARMLDRESMPMAVFLIAEAWSADIPAGEPRKYARPEDDPNRVEVVVCTGVALDGRVRHAKRPVRRVDGGGMTAGGEWVRTPAGVPIRAALVLQVYRGLFNSVHPSHA